MGGMGIIAGRYILEDLIGQGAMGAVYLGIDTQTDESVAIKWLKPEIIREDPDFVQRFVREGEALRRLNHPNIVKVLDVVEESSNHYIVLEYVSGGTLAEYIHQQEHIPVQRVLEIALDLADALTRAHRLNIIHRDLKPANVLLAQDGTPRLTDFGHAQMGDQSRLTRSGYLVGTYAYLSPEMAQGLPIDERADIWAFGVMLYEMLAGKRPFEHTNPAALLTTMLTKPVPDLRPLRPDAPEALLQLIEWMLEKDRDQRIPSVRQVGAVLEALLHGGDTTALLDTSRRTPKPAASIPLVENPGDLATDIAERQPPQATPSPYHTPGISDLRAALAQSDPAMRTVTPLPSPLQAPVPPGAIPAALTASTPPASAPSARTPWLALVGVMALVAAVLAVVVILPNLTGNTNAVAPGVENLPADNPALAVAPVAPGEYMVLVADFEAVNTTAPNPARFVYDNLVQQIENNPYSNIRIRRYEQVLATDAEALQVAEQVGAAVIIWGRYFAEDDIEANIQIGSLASFQTLHFERALLTGTVNVRVRLSDPRAQTLAHSVLAVFVTLHSVNSDVFEVNRIAVMLAEVTGDLPEIDATSIAGHVHRSFQYYISDPAITIAESDAALDLDRTANPLLPMLSVTAYLRTGDLASVRGNLDALNAAQPDWPMVHFLQATVAVVDGRYEAAIPFWTQVIEARPDDWYPINFRAATYYLMGDYENARRDYDVAIALEPQTNFPYIIAAMIALRQGRIRDSALLAQTVVERFPDTTFSVRMVETMFGENAGDMAVFGPSFSMFTNMMLQRYPRALADAEAVIAINPNLSDLHLGEGFSACNLGYAALERGDSAEAIEYFTRAETAYTRALDVDPDYGILYVLRGEVRRNLGNMPGAFQDGQTATTFDLGAEYNAVIALGTTGQLSCRNFYADALRLVPAPEAAPEATPEATP